MSTHGDSEREWRTLYETSERLNERLERQLAFKHEAWAVLRSALAGVLASTFKHTTRMRELSFLRRARLQQSLVALGPTCVNTLLGREVFPLGVADTALIETTFSAMTDASWQLLINDLMRARGGEQIAAVWMGRYEHFKEKERER